MKSAHLGALSPQEFALKVSRIFFTAPMGTPTRRVEKTALSLPVANVFLYLPYGLNGLIK
jgi:hypothetical protein